MGNLLTHGLLAGAIMAVANLLMGMEPISWNVFLTAMMAIALNLDSWDARISEGSPVSHSIGFGMFMVYIAGVGAYFSVAMTVLPASAALGLIMAIGVGVLAHLLAVVASGGNVFTVPRNLKPESWLVICDCDSGCFWPAWGRFSLGTWRLRDSHLNAISLGTIILSIGLFRYIF